MLFFLGGGGGRFDLPLLQFGELLEAQHQEDGITVLP